MFNNFYTKICARVLNAEQRLNILKLQFLAF